MTPRAPKTEPTRGHDADLVIEDEANDIPEDVLETITVTPESPIGQLLAAHGVPGMSIDGGDAPEPEEAPKPRRRTPRRGDRVKVVELDAEAMEHASHLLEAEGVVITVREGEALPYSVRINGTPHVFEAHELEVLG